jgi:hypothetical protein
MYGLHFRAARPGQILHRSLKTTDTTQSAGAGQSKQLTTVDRGGP